MNSPRIYTPNLILDEAAAHHVARVLRMQIGDALRVFNGQGGEYAAIITAIDKKKVSIALGDFDPINRESPLQIHLGQSLALGDRMDYAIQKCVEMGVHEITPLWTERSNVKLDPARLESRLQHWQKLIISACEQCGRNYLPLLHAPVSFSTWINKPAELKLILQAGGQALKSLPPTKNILMTVGPEGGFSHSELSLAAAQGWTSISLGPRILRTETAGLAAIAALQALMT